MRTFVIRYAEVGLKGKNRNWFEKILMDNIRKHLSGLAGKSRVDKVYGRVIAESSADPEQIRQVLLHIPGIANFSQAFHSNHDIKDIGRQAVKLTESYVEKRGLSSAAFKVTTQRSYKNFPLKSMEISALVGGDVLERFPEFKVNLSEPEIEVGVEIWQNNRSVVYLEKHAGQGGLPSGTSGRVISFISGGIDSPVASWLMMKRGCLVTFLHFHSFPFVGEQSRRKVVDLVGHLSRYQPESDLIIAPFAEIQKAVKLNCQEKNRTIIYRRMMYKVAEKLKEKYKALAFVTGEAVGQVASQTLENIACTEAAASIPVARPLIGMGKAEIVSLAQEIGSYQISVQPFDDCCTVFQPKRPETRGKPIYIEKDELKLPVDQLVAESVENIELVHFESRVEDKYWE